MSDQGAHPRAEACDEFTVVGTEIRTTNDTESDPATAQIGAHWQRFYATALADRIPNRTDGAVLYGVYTGYESDYRGAYSHLIACEVSNGGNVPPGNDDADDSSGEIPRVYRQRGAPRCGDPDVGSGVAVLRGADARPVGVHRGLRAVRTTRAVAPRDLHSGEVRSSELAVAGSGSITARRSL